ncbi:MAG: anion transporter, partial [Gammaproteobacteria bacterium]|nr:anion transporter [Gammaproteobacteria bacterium]
MTKESEASEPTYKKVGLLLGPAVFIVMLMSPAPESLGDAGWRTAAVGLWMAIWWATEAIPVAVTALLPLVLFPLLGIKGMRETAAPFANPIIYLFLGGFLVALAIERWDLHRRIALTILHFTGANARSLIGGFMLAAAMLSMWVTNTSTTLMILPIAISVIAVINSSITELSEKERSNFQVALVLGVAYGATIGGVATLVGTPPNAFLASFMKQEFDVAIGFGQWMLVGLPITAVMLPLAWQSLTRVVFPVDFHTSGAAK